MKIVTFFSKNILSSILKFDLSNEIKKLYVLIEGRIY